MKKIASLTGIIFFFLLAFSPLAFKKGDKERMNEAIDKSLLRLQKTSYRLLQNFKVGFTGDHQALDLIDFSLAKEKGFSIQDSIFLEATDHMVNYWNQYKSDLSEANDNNTNILTAMYDLWALSAIQYKPNNTTARLVSNIMQRQSENGSWVNLNAGPSEGNDSFSATALALRAIQYYKPADLQSIVAARVSHAKTWLMHSIPQSNEERVFQILGLTWSAGDPAFIKQLVKSLLAKQQADGGWSTSSTVQTDVYSTGQSLYVLNQCGNLNTEDSAYQRGISFLLNSHQEDGSGQRAGRNWATMALLLAVK